MTRIRPVRGTRDFYPAQMAMRSWLYRTVKTVSERYGYQEYDTPILETLELYAAKSGEELVKEQAYTFSDRGGETLVLRPEITPGLARMVAQQQQHLPKPIRWWSYGPCWRYERPALGRTREFYQWNLDLIGAESAYADAEILLILVDLFRAVGLTSTQVVIRISHRGLLGAQLRRLGLAEGQLDAAFRLIDRRDKLSNEQWLASGRETVGLTGEQLDALQALLQEQTLWTQCPELVQVFELLAHAGTADFLEFDPTIVRGLGYYTGVVFEAWAREGLSRAILGGGRYADLVAAVGGQPLGGVGVGMGDYGLGLLLEHYGLQPALTPSPTQVLVTTFPECLTPALTAAARLRAAGLQVEVYPDPAKLQKQLHYANAYHIPLAILIGPDEAARSAVIVRDLTTGQQHTVPLAELEEFVLGLSVV